MSATALGTSSSRLKWAGLCLLMLPLLAACDSILPPNQRLESDVLEIKTKLNDSISRQESTERSLSSQMGSISDNLDKQTNMTSTAMDELQRRVTAQSDEINKLRGEVESLNVSLKEANSRAASPNYNGAPGTYNNETTTSATDTGAAVEGTPAAAPATPANMNANQMLAQADQLFQAGQYAQAKEAYTQALSQNPGGELKTDILFGLGESCSKLNDPASAEDSYKQAISADRKNPKAWVALDRVADIEAAQGHKDDAIKYYEYILKNRTRANYPDLDAVQDKLNKLKGNATPDGPIPQ